MKKIIIFVMLMIVLIGFTYAETSSSSLNWASKRYVDGNFCALSAPSCIFLGNMTFAGDVHIIGQVFNVTVTNIYINATEIIGLNETIQANEKYWNETDVESANFNTTGKVIGKSFKIGGNSDFVSRDGPKIYKSAVLGMVIQGATGTVTDFAYVTPTGTRFFENPTGTTDIHFGPTGAVDVVIASSAANRATPTFTIYGYPTGMSKKFLEFEVVHGASAPRAKISSDSGEIWFDDENLETSGTGTFGDMNVTGTGNFEDVIIGDDLTVGGVAIASTTSLTGTSFPVLDVTRVSAGAGTYGGMRLTRNYGSGTANPNGIGVYFEATDSVGDTGKAGFLGGGYSTTTNGAEIGQLILAPAYHGADPYARTDLVLRATGTATSTLLFNGGGDADFGTSPIITSNDIRIESDSSALELGVGNDAKMYYDSKDFIINPKNVGTGVVSVKGSLNVSENITALNVFLPQYIFSHTNVTLPIIPGAGTLGNWTNVTFSQEDSDVKQGISHTYNDGTNHTFTIMEDGIYEINYDMDVEDTSVSASDIDVAARLILADGTELLGSVFETDIKKQGAEVELTHDFLVECTAGDQLVLQFIAQDEDVQISTHGTYGDHPESVTIVINKIANLQ